MKAIILAGGKGMRLQSVVSDVPKPMAPVGGRPFLEYILLQLASFDLKDVILSIGYKGNIISSYFGDGRKLGLSITYSDETTPLGTGGAAKKAFQLVNEEAAVVMNGDSYFDVDFKKFISFHRNRGSFATIALVPMGRTGRYGKVVVNDAGAVTAFDEKISDAAGLINTGVYMINKNILFQHTEDAFSMERDVFPDLIGNRLSGWIQHGFFIDIGIPEDYRRLAANPSLLSVYYEG